MVHVMGCDPHLDSYTAAVLDEVGRQVDVVTRSNDRAGWVDAVRVARRHRVERVGIEAASGYGRALAQTFTAAGIEVIEIPTRLTAHGRKVDGKGKSDRGDATVVARAVLAGDGLPLGQRPGVGDPPGPDGTPPRLGSGPDPTDQPAESVTG